MDAGKENGQEDAVDQAKIDANPKEAAQHYLRLLRAT